MSVIELAYFDQDGDEKQHKQCIVFCPMGVKLKGKKEVGEWSCQEGSEPVAY